jgi:hypothetical protein
MPLVNEANLGSPKPTENFANQGFKNAQGANFNQSFNQTNQSNEAFNSNQTQKGLFTLPPALMQIIP